MVVALRKQKEIEIWLHEKGQEPTFMLEYRKTKSNFNFITSTINKVADAIAWSDSEQTEIRKFSMDEIKLEKIKAVKTSQIKKLPPAAYLEFISDQSLILLSLTGDVIIVTISHKSWKYTAEYTIKTQKLDLACPKLLATLTKQSTQDLTSSMDFEIDELSTVQLVSGGILNASYENTNGYLSVVTFNREQKLYKITKSTKSKKKSQYELSYVYDLHTLDKSLQHPVCLSFLDLNLTKSQ